MANENHGERIRQELTEQILSGEYPPGQRLDEQKIADRHHVSRTPIREALQQLAASGLVEIKPRRGAFVRRLGQQEILDLFEAMGELEAICARLAAQRMTMMEIAHLEELVSEGEALAKAGKGQDYAQLNRTFHRAIFEGAHNASLLELANILRLRTSPYRNAQFTSSSIARERLLTSQQEHLDLLQAIQARDGDAAQRLMSRHITAASIAAGKMIGQMINRR